MADILVFGFIRNIEKETSLIIPTSIIDIILLYYYIHEFKFIPNPCFDISDDGLSATSRKGSTFATIQFGDFFQKSDNIIYSVTFALDDNVVSVCSGIGFITDKFEQWNHGNTYNKCKDNHSCSIYWSGCYGASPEFNAINPKYDKHSIHFKGDMSGYENNEFSYLFGGQQKFFGKSRKVVVEMNLIERKAKIYNSEYYNDNNGFEDGFLYMFDYNLPENEAIAIMIDTGACVQTFHVVQQSFRYKN